MVVAWFPPLCLAAYLVIKILWPTIFPKEVIINYGKVYDQKDNLVYLAANPEEIRAIQNLVPSEKDQIFYEKGKIPIFDENLLYLLKLPKEAGALEYCFYHLPYTINNKNIETASNDILHVQSGSTTLELPKYPAKLCQDKPEVINIVGFRFEDEPFKTQAKDWGLKIDETKRALANTDHAYYQVRPKYRSIVGVIPIVIFYAWWTLLIFYRKMKNEFIDNHIKR